MLSGSTRSQLDRKLTAYESSTGHQIVLHTTPSLEGLTIEDYSLEIADAWKAGHKGLDNGVILTVAPKERKVRIEVGYGLEGVIPDATASRIIREIMIPQFRSGGFQAGILSGVDAILAAAKGEVVQIPRAARRDSRRRGGGFNASPLVWLLVFLIFGFRGLFFLPFVGGFGRRGGFGGGGLGGGGFSGGGGGFGGGGASGGW